MAASRTWEGKVQGERGPLCSSQKPEVSKAYELGQQAQSTWRGSRGWAGGHLSIRKAGRMPENPLIILETGFKNRER